jgi:hypothetical protein
VAEGQVLRDAVRVGLIDQLGCTETAAPFGAFASQQVAFTRSRAEDFAFGGDLKSFGHGFAGLNTFWATHKLLLLKKEREI